MNTITKIILSLSLIAFVAQPVHSAPYKDHVKKTGKIIGYAALAYMGFACLQSSKYFVRNMIPDFYESLCKETQEKREWEEFQHTSFQLSDFAQEQINSTSQRIDALDNRLAACIVSTGACTYTGIAFLFYGIRGLKKEICPNFNPIKWMKNKLSQESEQTA